MSDDDRLVFFKVPKNRTGRKEIWYLVAKSDNIFSRQMRRGDNDKLFPLYDKFNGKFDIIIDQYEDERLPAKCVDKALEMTRAFAATHTDEVTQRAVKVLLEGTEAAKKYGGFVEFCF